MSIDAELQQPAAEVTFSTLPTELDALAREFALTIETLAARDMHDSAEALAHQMVQIVPGHSLGWKTLAFAHLRRGNLAEALAPLERAGALPPEDAELKRHLGAARALRDALAADSRGEYAQAGALYQNVLAVYPMHPDANHRLGVVAIRLHQPEASLPYLERAIGANPNQLQYWANYIDGLLQADQLKAAWLVLEMAQQRGLAGPAIDQLIGVMTKLSTEGAQKLARPVAAAPGVPAGHAQSTVDSTQPLQTPEKARARGHQGRQTTPTEQQMAELARHYNTGQTDQALVASLEFVQRFPAHAFGWKVLSVTLHKLGQYDEALQHALTALEVAPEDTDVLQVAAGVFASKGRYEQAETLCARLLQLRPNYGEAYRVMGVIKSAIGRFDEAERLCRKALELAGTSGMTCNPLGVTLMKMGRLSDAAAVFREAIGADPDNDLAYSNLAFCLTHSENIAPQELFAEHRRFAERFEAPLKPHWPQHTNTKDPARRLRVGFISGDFCHHAVANFLEPVLEHLARDNNLSLHAYSNTSIHDETTERLRALFAHWRHVVGMQHEAVADLIRGDQIDILIDLAGHTAENRLRCMARKPAPLQASWIGYPGTTGLEAVDYFFADHYWVPEAFKQQFTEHIVYLPAVAPFQADKLCPPLNMSPAQRNGYVTFGSFNRLDKLRRDVIALWARVLHAVPGSRMLIGAMPRDNGVGELVEWFAEEGIVKERLDFRARSSVPVYLQQHHHVDICLDSFPFSGLTTVLHSLWMGVPTVTLPADTVPGRSGYTAMSHVGLEQFIATSKDDYVLKAAAAAADVPALAAIRAGLRERCQQSAMFRPEQIANGMSDALRVMWRRWCEGLPAQSFDVSSS
ncbi:O-linked N-acetylglucosamine transferase family protein [Paraburkholderia sp. HP33-1]|uniref:O-linked N-acetylglucosamine transferase family protein n=1 Tax=Paraburkholderia sp. HP33-1 TaxID=2883243 RepID=UPI001F45C6C1|nr:tetratricopeptide repeat protein [Paraburkholderia sp. HP33-1]